VVIWTQPARNDLNAIFEYIALDSKFYARNTVRNIVEKASSLIEHPQVGRIVPEIENVEIREVFIYSYRIIYQILTDKIAILTEVHGNRDLNKSDIPIL
jgi:plasmid stabilization system protein ParE